MAYRFPGRPPGTDFSDSSSMASSIGDYREVEKMAYRFPGRPPGTDLSDSNSNEDCRAFAEAFCQSLADDASKDDNFWE